MSVIHQLDLIGDEIHFAGHVVAIVASDVPASVVGSFEDFIRDPIGELEDDRPDPEPDEIADGVRARFTESMDELETMASKAARGGLITVAALAKIVAQLKEEL